MSAGSEFHTVGAATRKLRAGNCMDRLEEHCNVLFLLTQAFDDPGCVNTKKNIRIDNITEICCPTCSKT